MAAAADLAAAIPDADLVIEAVVENLAVKQELFERLATLAPDAVLATNTSVLPIGAVTERVEDGSRVIGTHFGTRRILSRWSRWCPARAPPQIRRIASWRC